MPALKMSPITSQLLIVKASSTSSIIRNGFIVFMVLYFRWCPGL